MSGFILLNLSRKTCFIVYVYLDRTGNNSRRRILYVQCTIPEMARKQTSQVLNFFYSADLRLGVTKRAVEGVMERVKNGYEEGVNSVGVGRPLVKYRQHP